MVPSTNTYSRLTFDFLSEIHTTTLEKTNNGTKKSIIFQKLKTKQKIDYTNTWYQVCNLIGQAFFSPLGISAVSGTLPFWTKLFRRPPWGRSLAVVLRRFRDSLSTWASFPVPLQVFDMFYFIRRFRSASHFLSQCLNKPGTTPALTSPRILILWAQGRLPCCLRVVPVK